MRTNIDIDESLMFDALRLSGLPSKRAVVNEALSEFVAKRRRLDLRDLARRVRFSEGYDQKAMHESQAP